LTKFNILKEPTDLPVGAPKNQPTDLPVGAPKNHPTDLVVGAPAPIPAFLRQLAEKELMEPTALVVGAIIHFPEDLSSGALKQEEMDTRKFEYLETIRETIEIGDYDELDDLVEDIRDQVKADPEFQEIFGEIKSRHYGDVLSLIDEFIYQDIQTEADEFLNEDSLQRLSNLDSGLELIYNPETGIPEEITFVEFNDDAFSTDNTTEED
jgi:hypothetical protein